MTGVVSVKIIIIYQCDSNIPILEQVFMANAIKYFSSVTKLASSQDFYFQASGNL